MAHMDGANIFGGLLFSGIGFVAFTYGKKNQSVRHMALGGALMVYCYFTPTILTYAIGVILTIGLFL